MVSPGNIYTSYIIQSEQVVFKNIYAYIYIPITTSNEKEVMDLKERKGGHRRIWKEIKEREK